MIMDRNQDRTEYAIETSNLNLWYGDFQALLGVCSKIKAGIITALIGPSGCGKTTLLRCFNRMNERFENVRVEGSVEILGNNIYDPEVSVVELRKRVGMVFQRPNPLPLSIYDNVAFGLRVHSPRRDLYKNDIDAEELLLSLRGQYTIIIVTHNMAQARRISDECIYMLNGELIEHGETSSLFLNPIDKRTEEYIEGRYG
jgi:ABC-type phosphate transport system ATPase subunit